MRISMDFTIPMGISMWIFLKHGDFHFFHEDFHGFYYSYGDFYVDFPKTWGFSFFS